jgi:CMP-N,N'-diacetyllegionaminic acid synthase
MEVVLHAIETVERQRLVRCDPIVVLEPTSPLRLGSDIRAAVELNAANPRPNVISASFVQDVDWMFRTTRSGAVRWLHNTKRSRRQDQPVVYVPNGVVYVLTRARLGRPWTERAVAYPVPRDRAVDIDDGRDLWIARALATAKTTIRKRTIAG